MRKHGYYRAALRMGSVLALAITLGSRICAAPWAQDSGAASQRIVSLAPSITKQLYLLGAADKLVGITTFCPQPDDGRKIALAGSLIDPSVEVIVGMRPDLVLASPLTGAKRLHALRSLGVGVAVFPQAKDFDEICEQFTSLGKEVDLQDEAAKIVGEARAATAALAIRVDGVSPVSVFFQIGVRPLCTVMKGTFLDDLVRKAGGTNIAGDARTPAYSREAVLAADPDCIVIATMGLTGTSEREKWRGFETLSAVKNDRIYVVESDDVCSPTPPSFVSALERMIALLHPDAGAASGDSTHAR